MNDRVIIRRLKKCYPYIHHTIAPDPVVKDMKMLPKYFEVYKNISGLNEEDILSNKKKSEEPWDEQRTIFIAVMAMLVDPFFFEYESRSVYGFEKEMTSLLKCKNYWKISYNLNKARNLMNVYPIFKETVGVTFEKIKNYEVK